MTKSGDLMKYVIVHNIEINKNIHDCFVQLYGKQAIIDTINYINSSEDFPEDLSYFIQFVNEDYSPKTKEKLNQKSNCERILIINSITKLSLQGYIEDDYKSFIDEFGENEEERDNESLIEYLVRIIEIDEN